MKGNFLKIISLLFDPICSLTVLIIMLILNSNLAYDNKIFLIIAIFVFYILAPLQVIVYFLEKGWISDIEIKNRSQRIYIEIATLIFWLGGLIFVFNFEKILFKSFVIIFIELLICFIINFKLKISLHVSIYTLMIMLLTYAISAFVVIGLIFVPLIIYSRYKLHKHTLQELFAGFIVPVIVVVFLWNMIL